MPSSVATVSVDAARQIARTLCPTDAYTEPLMVAGLDQGNLWRALYELPCKTPAAPGHTPPIYFLAHSAERVEALLQNANFAAMLDDPRVRLFVGKDATVQCERFMIENPHTPWPKMCATVDSSIWPAGESVDTLVQRAAAATMTRFNSLKSKIAALYAGYQPSIPFDGRPLRILGITSRYTTFLQHSMRDWLEAMSRMGHETTLCIESADHEIFGALAFAETTVAHRPDLVVMIDHYRAEMQVLPANLPCVMWVQDNLPNIFSDKAGAAQGPLDFCLGYGRITLPLKHGYPAERFCAARVGVNEHRFSGTPLSAGEFTAHACDVSYVSHASQTAESILQEQLERQTDAAHRRALENIFERMKAHYESDGEALCHRWINAIINESFTEQQLKLDANCVVPLTDFFAHRVGNALFRHQTLRWVSDLGIHLRLYGRGWESHPHLAKHACGTADNASQLRAIYQSSKINLQATPFGAVHQRLLDGLIAGGFFLIRETRGDRLGLLHQKLWRWCVSKNISNDLELTAGIDDEIRAVIGKIDWLEGHRAAPRDFPPLFDACRAHAEVDFTAAADSLWPEHYDAVSFGALAALKEKIELFLHDIDERARIASAMRERILGRLTYAAISRRLFNMISANLAAAIQPARRAA